MNREDTSFLEDMFQKIGLDHIHAIIINQITTVDMPRSLPTPHAGIRIFSSNEVGLSKSRNMALQYSRGDILVIADDDVVYEKEAIETITKCHAAFPDIGILTFKMTGTSKNYFSSARAHNLRSILRVSSWEITMKRAVATQDILFDERFGLGARYPMGEENIWMRDVLRAGLKARFAPHNIVIHEGISTGKIYNAVNEKARGAVFTRMYGLIAIPMSCWFAIKKYKAFRSKHSLLAEVYYLLAGGFHFFFSSLYKR